MPADTLCLTDPLMGDLVTLVHDGDRWRGAVQFAVDVAAWDGSRIGGPIDRGPRFPVQNIVFSRKDMTCSTP